MKCPECKHDHTGPAACPVIIESQPPKLCGCTAQPLDMAICSNCEESLAYSYSTAQLVPGFPYLFVCVWCVHCKHIITSQITVMLPPLPKDAATPPRSNIHVPGGPL